MSTDDHQVECRFVRVACGEIAVHLQGDPGAPAVVMAHSILSSSATWERQSALLCRRGFRTVRLDAPGHGQSPPPERAFTLDDLTDDAVAVLDTLQIARAHYVGLSLGGMSGLGLGIRHPDRLLSLVLCDARADAPPAFVAPWDERVAVAEQAGSCAPLAVPTIERWFGQPFVAAHPEVATRLIDIAGGTSVRGFAGCARALQGLDYLPHVGRIGTPTTLVVGENDGPLPAAMRHLQSSMAGSVLVVIPNAGHLPNIDQPAPFDEALLAHLGRTGH